MDTYFSSINDCSFWKTDLFFGENDMGSYENSVYPRIFPLILIGLVMAGLMYIALPILLVVGIITWFVKTVF